MKQNQITEISNSYTPSRCKKEKIQSTQEAYCVLKEFFAEGTIALQEQFVVMYLNANHNVLGIHVASKGGITGTIADIRLILGIALKTASTAIIVAHNHPSGNLHPSKSDEELTKKLKHAATLLDINLLDHLIISESGFLVWLKIAFCSWIESRFLPFLYVNIKGLLLYICFIINKKI
jgi:DNA repair protein RadC